MDRVYFYRPFLVYKAEQVEGRGQRQSIQGRDYTADSTLVRMSDTIRESSRQEQRKESQG